MEPRATRQNKRPLSLFSSRVSLLFLFSLGGLPFTPFAKGGSALPLLAGGPTLYAFSKGWVSSSSSPWVGLPFLFSLGGPPLSLFSPAGSSLPLFPSPASPPSFFSL